MRDCIVVGTHVAGLGVIRGLGEAGVPVTALRYLAKDMGHASRHVRRHVRVPHPEAEAAAFVDFLLAASDLHGGVLVPTEDAAMVTIARHRAELEGCYAVALPEWPVIERIIDKRHTYELAASLGIPCPRTFSPASEEEALRAAAELGFPCLVKPRLSHRFFERFRAKMVEAGDAGALLAACGQAWEAGLDVLVQELIPGGDGAGVNYNSYFWEGHPVAEFTAAKVRLAPPRFGFPRVVVSRPVPEVIEPGRAILQALGFWGFSCTEFKLDGRDGRYKLMEVNGRHNVSSRLAVACGLNFPRLTYEHLATGRLPAPAAPRQGVYWIDEFKDLAYSLSGLGREGHGLRSYLAPYLAPHVMATFAWDDPRPFLTRSAYLAGEGLRRLVGKVRKSASAAGDDEKGRPEPGSPAPRWTGPR